MTRRWLPAGLFVALGVIPAVPLRLPAIFPDPLNAPGTLQVLALCLVFGGVALSYDLVFGYAGLLSFGHALFFASGAYGANIALSRWGWTPLPAVVLAAAAGIVLPLVLGAVALRVRGIAFAMVTLAFAVRRMYWLLGLKRSTTVLSDWSRPRKIALMGIVADAWLAGMVTEEAMRV